MDHKSDADVLADAREYLESHGWWRGAIRGPNGRQVCGLGAVIMSQGWVQYPWDNNLPTTNPIYNERLNRILGKVLDVVDFRGNGYYVRVKHDASSFTSWNDHCAKSKQEVLDAFAKAEKIERAGFDPDA